MPRIVNSRRAYDGYVKVTVLTLVDEDGEPYAREVVSIGQSACVLPYDPERKVALLVRLPRAPLLMQEIATTLIEAPAGMIDETEGPETTIRREAMEEAGVNLTTLEPVAVCWPSPGVLAERTHLYLAPYAAGDRVGPGGGLAQEHEGIVVEERALSELWRAAQSGALHDLKTLTLLLALNVRRPEMFAL